MKDPKTIIIGYGNIDRQDDGVAWHILHGICESLGWQCPNSYYEPFDAPSPLLRIDFMLQLVPELSEIIADYDRVCFVDAHTGAIQDDLSIQKIIPEFQGSPFTHHLTPQMCLELSRQLYHKFPEAWLISVRGYEFGFSNSLSPATSELASTAVDWITKWIRETK